MERDDSELWSRSRAGDAAAFGVIFERHATAIYNYCFRRTGSWSMAEYLLSVVFLEAWRRRDVELPAGKLLPWLYGIATNVARNQSRAQRRYRAALNRLPRPRPGAPDLEQERVEDEEHVRKVLALLQKLPRREQDVFVLCAWFVLSYEDAAVALAIPVGTVRSRLSRARARLRELQPSLGHMENERAEPVEEKT